MLRFYDTYTHTCTHTLCLEAHTDTKNVTSKRERWGAEWEPENSSYYPSHLFWHGKPTDRHLWKLLLGPIILYSHMNVSTDKITLGSICEFFSHLFKNVYLLEQNWARRVDYTRGKGSEMDRERKKVVPSTGANTVQLWKLDRVRTWIIVLEPCLLATATARCCL